MTPSTRKLKKQSGKAWKEAIAIPPCIDGVQDALDRFQVAYEEGLDIDAAFLDLQAHVEDLSDAVDKIEVQR